MFANVRAVFALFALLLPAVATADQCYVRPYAYAQPTYVPQYTKTYAQPTHAATYNNFYPAYFPVILYQAGYDLERLAIADLAVRRYTQSTVASGVQQGYAQAGGVPNQPNQVAAGTPSQNQPFTGSPGKVLSSKCAACHGAAKPSGGLVLDGSVPVSDATFRRAFDIFGLGVRIPTEMQSVVGGMQTQDKGAIFSELAQLRPGAGAVETAPVEQAPPLPLPSTGP